MNARVHHVDALCVGDRDDVVDARITFELGADPDFVDLSAPRDEHLPNGLAALDLATTQSLRATG